MELTKIMPKIIINSKTPSYTGPNLKTGKVHVQEPFFSMTDLRKQYILVELQGQMVSRTCEMQETEFLTRP